MNKPATRRASALIIDGVENNDEGMDSADILTDDYEGIATPGPQTSVQQAVQWERFMKENVEIAIAPKGEGSTEPDAFLLAVEKFEKTLTKGRTYIVPRYAVEVLLRAETDNFRQERANGGQPDDLMLYRDTRISHSFAITKDTAEGLAWARRIQMKQA